MHRFRRMGTLQKFAAVHAVFHNHFNYERHLTSRTTYKANRSAAMAEWRILASRHFGALTFCASRKFATVKLTMPSAARAEWRMLATSQLGALMFPALRRFVTVRLTVPY